jgi:hypothetical protein
MKCPFCKAITSANQTSDVCRNCGQKIPAPPRMHYGSGVRNQVFEVVVRQAMAGAPWREICKGPMSINNISIEEVEAEVRRRFEFVGGTYRPEPLPPDESKQLKNTDDRDGPIGYISKERSASIQKKLRIRFEGLREQLKEALECGSTQSRDQMAQSLKQILVEFDDLIRDLKSTEEEEGELTL